MKMVYTNEDRFIVSNVKNILSQHRIETVLKNEYAAGGIGELSAFDAWLELWVLNETDYDAACKVIDNAFSDENAVDWLCSNCKESNDVAFEYCWSCQHEPS